MKGVSILLIVATVMLSGCEPGKYACQEWQRRYDMQSEAIRKCIEEQACVVRSDDFASLQHYKYNLERLNCEE